MPDVHDLELLLRSDAPLILVESLEEPRVITLFARLALRIAQGYGERARTLVLVSHALEVPPEIRHLCVRLDLRLADRNRRLALIRDEAQAWRQAGAPGVRAAREAVDQLSQNLLGVTESDARRLIRNAIRI